MTIGRLAKAAGCKPETIRYYEQSGLLRAPPRTPSGYRLYDDGYLRSLTFIRKGREFGFSLGDLAAMLRLAEDPQASCAEITRMSRRHLAVIQRRIGELQAVRDRLSELVGQCADREVAECRIVQALLGWGNDDHPG